MKAYAYKMYTKATNGNLDNQIDRFGIVYNHCIALHKRYFKLTGKVINLYYLKSHLTKLKHRPKWEPIFDGLPSQAVQDVVIRIDKAYKLFFSNLKRKERTSPPKFKKVKKYASFTLTQAGYKFDNNKVRLNGVWYGFHMSRDWKGKIKTVTIKRDHCGDFFVVITTDWNDVEKLPTSGKSVGFDFGMKTFLIGSDETDIKSPLFLQKAKDTNLKLSRAISKKVAGSNNRRKAVLRKARFMRHLANQRDDFQWKLANRLVREYDVLCFEDLNIRGMSNHFGKKIGEYGLYSFLQKLKYLAAKHGKEVRFVNRYYASSKTCHVCGWKNDGLKLSDRSWTCPECGTHHDRDRNAAINILREGTSSRGLDIVSPNSREVGKCRLNPESHGFSRGSSSRERERFEICA